VDERTPETASPAAPARNFDTGHLTKGIGRRAARGAALTMSSNGVRFVLETARIVVLARLLQPADYGLVAMVTALTGVMEMFKDLGLNTATVTREKLSHDQVSTLFWINAGFGLLLSLLTAAVAPAIAWFYGDPRLLTITLALAPSFLLAGLAVQHQALLRRQMRFGVLAGIRIADVITGLVVGLAIAWLGGGYWALVAMPLASAVASGLGVWIYSRWLPGPPVKGTGAREMLRFGSQVTGTNLVTYFSRRLDQFLLGWWSGATALGLYTKSVSLVEAPLNRALAPIATVVLPTLSQLSSQPKRYRDGYLRILEMLCLVSMPGAAFMIGCAAWLIPFLLGPQWKDAAPMFAVLSVTGFLRPIEGSNWWLFVTQERAAEGLRWSVISAGISAASVVVGLPWGGIGVATAVTVASVIRLPLLVWFTTHVGPVRAADVYRAQAPPTFAALVALGALLALEPYLEAMPHALALAAGLAVTGAVFFAALATLPAGRRTLRDAYETAMTLRRRKRA
jgi:O-antigen/teichoic acid export membrane protein